MRLGVYLHQHHVPIPKRVVCSPSVRTKETLDTVSMSWGAATSAKVVFDQAMYYLADPGYIDYVLHLDNSYDSILLIGHNPAMEGLVQRLADVDKFPPASFLQFEWSDLTTWSNALKQKGRLKLFVTPDMMEE
jgi:phosphohistidine phosphatase